MHCSTKLPDGWRRLPPRGYEDLDESRINPQLLKAMRDAFQKKQFPIYVFGSIGVGKSYAVALVFSRFSGTRVVFARYADFISDCARADIDGQVDTVASDGSVCQMTSKSWWKWIEDVDLLILDEVGTGTYGPLREDIFLRVLEARRRKPLLMTGNLSLDQISSQLSPRIETRVGAGTPIKVSGADRRRDGITERLSHIKDNR